MVKVVNARAIDMKIYCKYLTYSEWISADVAWRKLIHFRMRRNANANGTENGTREPCPLLWGKEVDRVYLCMCVCVP